MIIKAFIPSYRSVEISARNKQRYYTYRVEVHQNDNISYLDRRYSDFLILHKEIRRKFGNNTPLFPPKKVRNNSAKVLESRKTGLELYLKTLLLFNPIPNEVLGFLNLRQNRRSYRYEPSKVNSFLEDHYITRESAILNQPAAGFLEDPYVAEESDTSSNISDNITRGVLDALYNS